MNAVRYLRNCILVLGLDPKVAPVIRDPLNAHFYRYLRNGRVPYLRSGWRKSSPRSNQTSDETVKPRRPALFHSSRRTCFILFLSFRRSTSLWANKCIRALIVLRASSRVVRLFDHSLSTPCLLFHPATRFSYADLRRK